MKRIISIIILLSVVLIGCNSNCTKKSAAKTEVEINLPYDNTIDGYEAAKDFENNQKHKVIKKFNGTYYCNSATKKFHFTYCYIVKTISQQNIFVEVDRDKLISEGYSPCQKCLP